MNIRIITLFIVPLMGLTVYFSSTRYVETGPWRQLSNDEWREVSSGIKPPPDPPLPPSPKIYYTKPQVQKKRIHVYSYPQKK
jgi:hypothetical protein